MTATVAKCYPTVNSIPLVPLNSSLLSNADGMDNKEIRRVNMLMLAKEAGGLQSLADKTGTDAKYLSQVKNSWNGRGIGDDVARRIERALKKPKGWLDVLQDKKAAPVAQQLSAREEIVLELFRGLTPEQQLEQVQFIRAAYDANRRVQSFVTKPLRTYSNEEVERAFGKVPAPTRKTKKPVKPPRRDPGTAMDDFLEE